MTSLAVRGINYDAGVLYEGTFDSRPVWNLDDVRRDLTVIRDELSCNAVSIMATDNDRLAGALDRLLSRLVAAGRRHFDGPLTYGAGDWETINWERFDYVGLDTYRDGSNKGRYADDLRQHVRRGKPVLVVEFGCCSYEGAAERGPSGFEVLAWRSEPPTVPSRVTRNEQVPRTWTSRASGSSRFSLRSPTTPASPSAGSRRRRSRLSRIGTGRPQNAKPSRP